MRRLGRWAALTAVATALVVPTAPAAAEEPGCDVYHEGADGALELREDKPWGIRLDCWSSGASEELTVQRAPEHGLVGTPYRDPDFPEEWVVPYDPIDDYRGDDSLALQVSDGTGTALIDVALQLVANRGPGCDQRNGDDLYGHAELEGTAEWWIACADPDLQDYQDLQSVVEQEPGHGTLEVSAAPNPQTYEETLFVAYTPDPNFEGSDRFTVGMTDGDLTDSYSFFVNVSDGPWCQPSEPVEVRAGSNVKVLPFCTAPEWGDLTMSVPTAPQHGATSFVRMAIDYTADADASGSDSFTFQATGASGVSNVVTQEVTILPNAAPVCEDRTTTTPSGGTVDVALTCSDPDGDAHTIGVLDQPDHGTLGELVDGTTTYTPDPGWDGTDTFTYAASDYARTSAPATVTVAVTEEVDPVVDVTVVSQTPSQVARRGLRLLVGPDEPVTADVVVGISSRLAERLGIPRRIGRLRGVEVDQQRRVTVDLTRRASRAVRHRDRLALVVDLVARDEWGNATPVETRGVLR